VLEAQRGAQCRSVEKMVLVVPGMESRSTFLHTGVGVFTQRRGCFGCYEIRSTVQAYMLAMSQDEAHMLATFGCELAMSQDEAHMLAAFGCELAMSQDEAHMLAVSQDEAHMLATLF
jgi:hypothetical protein